MCVKITPEEGAEGLRGGGGGPVDAMEPARRWVVQRRTTLIISVATIKYLSDDPGHISDDRHISVTTLIISVTTVTHQ